MLWWFVLYGGKWHLDIGGFNNNKTLRINAATMGKKAALWYKQLSEALVLWREDGPEIVSVAGGMSRAQVEEVLVMQKSGGAVEESGEDEDSEGGEIEDAISISSSHNESRVEPTLVAERSDNCIENLQGHLMEPRAKHTLKLKEVTLHPAPCTMQPPPYNSHPTPYTLHNTPQNLHPTTQ